MKAFNHNPHPIDLWDFMYGRKVVTGGWDYEQEEKMLDEKSHQDKHGGSGVLTSSVNKLRRSVSERLFSMELGKITF